MRNLPSIGAMILTAALIAAPVLAPLAIAQSSDVTPAAPPGANHATTPSPSGTLGIASVKLANGWRASKLIGAAVYNEQNQKIGSVDDLILTQEDKVVVAVVQVGGFLGIGGKLVAVPYSQIRMENDHAVLPGATKDALGGLPAFSYGNT